MAKSPQASQGKSFVQGYKGVPSGIGTMSKLLQRMQVMGLSEFFGYPESKKGPIIPSPERATQLRLLREMVGGEHFGLSPEEAGQIQQQGRSAVEAAWNQATRGIGGQYSAGSITSGQRQAALNRALMAKSAGLADFQRQEMLRRLQEGRTGAMFRVQSAESLANALTGIPNFNQMNELMRTMILARNPYASVGAAGSGGGGGGGGGSPWMGLAGQAAGAAAGVAGKKLLGGI